MCRRLKSDPATPPDPVVIVTGLSDLEDRIKASKRAPTNVLSNPFHPMELRARFGSLTRMKHLLEYSTRQRPRS